MHSILDDIQNIGCSFQKLDIFYEMWQNGRINSVDDSRLISSELEYVLILCRGLFDDLQSIIKEFWRIARSHDNPRRQNKHLPDRFFEMICTGDNNDIRVLSKDEIVAKQKIFPELADYYLSQAEFFLHLRKCRDDIIHRGRPNETVFFISGKGFCISKASPLADLLRWSDQNTANKNLGSLKSLLASFVIRTIHAFEQFGVLIQNHISFFDEIVPYHRCLLRSRSTRYLMHLPDALEHNPWWNAIS